MPRNAKKARALRSSVHVKDPGAEKFSHARGFDTQIPMIELERALKATEKEQERQAQHGPVKVLVKDGVRC